MHFHCKSSVPEKYLRAMYGIEFTPIFVAPTFVGTGHKWVKFRLIWAERGDRQNF